MEINEANRQTSAQYNRIENLSVYGDAMIETSSGSLGQTSWQGDFSHFPCLDFPTVIRGGKWLEGAHSGVFTFTRDGGLPSYCLGSRAVVVAL